jgi:hypothetical protein
MNAVDRVMRAYAKTRHLTEDQATATPRRRELAKIHQSIDAGPFVSPV